MKQFPYFGPGIVVLAASGAALVCTPLIVRRANDAAATERIVQASHVLAQDAVLDSVPRALGGSAGDDALAQEGARDPLGDDLAIEGLSRGKVGSQAQGSIREAVHEPILEQINRANRAIARLVEPSVVHVSALNTMRRRNFSSAYASSGSGWIWNDDGYIVTNAHVVDGADRLQVQLFDGELRDAELVGLDLRTDVAVIKVDAGGLHPALRGESSSVEQGDMVYAFGSPFDFRFSMSAGIVSGLGRSTALDNIDYQNFIQTDAAINPGNSGGPLTDVRGRVIGMNTAIATNPGNSAGQAQFAGIGLAIPMSMIETTVTQLIETGEVRKGFLGVRLINLEAARDGGAPYSGIVERFKGEGAMLGFITPDSPAEAAGFRSGDVVVSIDGERITSDAAVRAIVSSRRPGDKVRFDVWRLEDGAAEGTRLTIEATLAELDASANLAPTLPRAMRSAGLLGFSTSTEERARRLGVPFQRGVLVEEVAEDSELASVVPVGSTITGIYNQSIGSVDEMYTRFARATEGMRGMRRRSFVEVPFTIVRPDGRVAQVLVPTPL